MDTSPMGSTGKATTLTATIQPTTPRAAEAFLPAQVRPTFLFMDYRKSYIDLSYALLLLLSPQVHLQTTLPHLRL